MSNIRLRIWLVLVAMLLIAFLTPFLRPVSRLADQREKIDLEAQIPTSFGDWRVQNDILPLLPNPEVQAKLDVLYTQVLARTYVNSAGQRVMLSVAYGSDQGSEATAVHRPEFCYSAQGFAVSDANQVVIDLKGHTVKVQRLVGQLAQRMEPISYWVTLDDSAVLPGFARKIEQLRFGLQGKIPDGMLVRVSSINGNVDESFRLQEIFLRDLYQNMGPSIRLRYFGKEQS